jgi:hypothetical protein
LLLLPLLKKASRPAAAEEEEEEEDEVERERESFNVEKTNQRTIEEGVSLLLRKLQ